MLDVAEGTGVAIYARVLATCVQDAGASAVILDDQSPGARDRNRLGRWLSAMATTGRDAAPRGGAPGAQERLSAHDIFREAQVFFNLHGRLLPVRCAQPPAVMHWTYPVPLFVEGARNLYTVHDLIPLTDPDLTGIPRGRHDRLLRRVAKQAAMLVTVSEATRTAVLRELAPAAPPVFNTLQAIEAPLQRDPALPATLRSGRYFLFCGTVEPRKNLSRLIAAHAASQVDQPLVIVGPEAEGHGSLETLIAAAPNVMRLPYQPRADLLGLIRRARALLFPSLAEGFGLPIAEAMTLGCPVLTSDRGAPAEIGGDAALLVAPLDELGLAEAIRALSTDDALCARLRAAGFARARRFTPQAYGRRLRALYAEALAPTPQGDAA